MHGCMHVAIDLILSISCVQLYSCVYAFSTSTCAWQNCRHRRTPAHRKTASVAFGRVGGSCLWEGGWERHRRQDEWHRVKAITSPCSMLSRLQKLPSVSTLLTTVGMLYLAPMYVNWAFGLAPKTPSFHHMFVFLSYLRLHRRMNLIVRAKEVLSHAHIYAITHCCFLLRGDSKKERQTGAKAFPNTVSIEPKQGAGEYEVFRYISDVL